MKLRQSLKNGISGLKTTILEFHIRVNHEDPPPYLNTKSAPFSAIM